MTEKERPARKKWYNNVGVMVIVMISVFAVATVGLAFWLLPDSSEIIRVMQWRMVNARTFRADISVSYNGSVENKATGDKTAENLALESRGPVDRSDPNKDNLSQTFALAVGPSDSAAKAGGELRVLGSRDFVNFSALPDNLGAIDVGAFKSKWLTFNIDNIRRNLALPIIGGEGKPVSDEDRRYLIDQVRITPFLQFEGRLKSEIIGGAPTNHYKVLPETLFFKDYVIQSETRRLGVSELSAEQRNFLDTFFANVTPDEGELWIGKRDYYLYRMRLRFKFSDESTGRHGTFDLTAAFSDFNKPVKIEAPTGDVQDIDLIVQSLLPSIAEHLPLAKEGRAQTGIQAPAQGGLPALINTTISEDSDEDGLPDSLEHFYGSDPMNPDTDGDGLKDGYEVDHGLNPTGPGKLFDFGIGQ